MRCSPCETVGRESHRFKTSLTGEHSKSHHMDCIFCKIAKKELASDIVYEDENFVAFKDIKPKAPVHLLIIPRKHIESVDHLEIHDRELMGELVLTAQKIARHQGLEGYKLQINVGRAGGQLIDHLHLHLLSGKIEGSQKDYDV